MRIITPTKAKASITTKWGPSRGCGGTGILHDGKLAVANNFVTWKTVQNGPGTVVFELGYAPYTVGSVKVSETRRITLEAGRNLNQVQTRFDLWMAVPRSLRRRWAL